MLPDFAPGLAAHWANKTLEELRQEAAASRSGMAFDAIRTSTGERVVIILCVTEPDQVALVESFLEMSEDRPAEDWAALTLAAVLNRNLPGPGFESWRDEYGRRAALALIVADPDSIRSVEATFSLPT